MITIKNDKGEICDYRIPYNVSINDEVENIQKLIDKCKQKMIETIGIPKEYYKECKQKMINTSGILKEYYKIHKINLKEE